MTVREMSRALDKPERTIQRWAVRAAEQRPSISERIADARRGTPVYYDLEDMRSILTVGVGSVIAAIVAEHFGAVND